MRKIGFAILVSLLVCLEIVLFSAWRTAPVTAVEPSVTYSWGYASLGSDRLFCKKTAFIPETIMPQLEDKVSGHLESMIVDDHYCANLTKPQR